MERFLFDTSLNSESRVEVWETVVWPLFENSDNLISRTEVSLCEDV